jgi:hypothetical protein
MNISDIRDKWVVLGRSLHPHGAKAEYSWSYNLEPKELSVFRLMQAKGLATTAKHQVEGGWELWARRIRK